MSSRADRRALLVVAIGLAIATGCASAAGMHRGQEAEQAQDYDRAVAEYTKLARANPSDVAARQALGRAKLRAADHGCGRVDWTGSRKAAEYQAAPS